MTNYASIITNFKGTKVLILGDVMIDAYLSGSADRMSPEAPVPVVSISEEVHKLGGAANVALNLMTLGAKPILCSVIGEEKSDRFLGLLRNRNFAEQGIVVSSERKTTQKTRVLDKGKQLLRVDEENTHNLSEREEQELMERLESLFATQKIDVLIFQDYNKGVLTSRVIEKAIALARANDVGTAVDPKLKNFLAYKGVTLFKPNLKEINEGLGLELVGNDTSGIESAMKRLREELGNEISFVTLSQYGVMLSSADETCSIAAHERNIIDVSGAGDTVISVATLCLAQGIALRTLGELSNLAGGLVCEKVGVEPITSQELTLAAEKDLNAH